MDRLKPQFCEAQMNVADTPPPEAHWQKFSSLSGRACYHQAELFSSTQRWVVLKRARYSQTKCLWLPLHWSTYFRSDLLMGCVALLWTVNSPYTTTFKDEFKVHGMSTSLVQLSRLVRLSICIIDGYAYIHMHLVASIQISKPQMAKRCSHFSICSFRLLAFHHLFWFHIISHHRVFIEVQHHKFGKLHNDDRIASTSYLNLKGVHVFLTTLLNYCVIAKKLYTTQIYKIWQCIYSIHISIVS